VGEKLTGKIKMETIGKKRYKYHVVRFEFKTEKEKDDLNNFLFSMKMKSGKSMPECLKEIIEFYRENHK